MHSPSCHVKTVVSSIENKRRYWTTLNKTHMSFSKPPFFIFGFLPIFSISPQEPEENTSVTFFSYSSVIPLGGFTQARDAVGFRPTVDVGFMLITSVCARLKQHTFLSSIWGGFKFHSTVLRGFSDVTVHLSVMVWRLKRLCSSRSCTGKVSLMPGFKRHVFTLAFICVGLNWEF